MTTFTHKFISLSCIFTVNSILSGFNIGLPFHYNNINKLVLAADSRAAVPANAKADTQNDYELLKKEYIDLKNNYGTLKNDYNSIKEHFCMLQKNNTELLEDNLSLQNTIKITANSGTKPRNYAVPPQIVSRGYYRTNCLGTFKITAYTPCKEECGNNLGITSSGKPIVAGYSVAVDNKIWPMGTIFYIKGIGYVVAMDTGGAISGKNRMDLAIFDKSEANQFGVRYMEVYLVKYGNGKVNLSKIFNKN